MNKLIVSSSPHIRTKHDTPRLMLDVIIALLPAVVAGAIIYGIRALLVVFTCVLTAVVSEFLFNLAVKKEQTVFDFSAIITGLILGLSLRADAPVWQCVLGSVFAIVVVKCLFGGLGANFANPAATGRVFMLVCFSGTLAGGVAPAPVGAPLVRNCTVWWFFCPHSIRRLLKSVSVSSTSSNERFDEYMLLISNLLAKL